MTYTSKTRPNLQDLISRINKLAQEMGCTFNGLGDNVPDLYRKVLILENKMEVLKQKHGQGR